MLVDRLKLGNDNVTWSDHLKYLGIMFKSGKRLQSDLDLESVKQIQWFCEGLDVKHIIDQRKLLFYVVLCTQRMMLYKHVLLRMFILQSFMACAASIQR